MALNNSINTQQTLDPSSTAIFADLKITNRTAYAVLTGGTTSSNPLQSIASVGTSGQVLTSAGAALPAFADFGGTVTVTQFDANGTWTKGTGTKYVQMFLWGGGGSGGSGTQGLTTLSPGGAGGAAGSVVVSGLPATFFGTSATITIGGSSTGGAVQANPDMDGNGGAAGNSTCVGSICTASNAAQAGSGTPFGPGTNMSSFPYIWSPASATNTWNPAQGGGGDYTNGGTPNQSATVPGGTGLQGTGGGGGAGADIVTERTGGNALPIKDPSLTNTIIAGGIGGVESGTINGGNGNDQPTGATSNGILVGGTGGGGGGGQKSGASAGAGGNGGIPGGGGGGGGGSLNGTSSGAGGNSARGRVIIVEFA